jgi:hypothetical protein
VAPAQPYGTHEPLSQNSVISTSPHAMGWDTRMLYFRTWIVFEPCETTRKCVGVNRSPGYMG